MSTHSLKHVSMRPSKASRPCTAPPGCNSSNLDLSTRILHPEKSVTDPYNAASPPIYQTATFEQTSALEVGRYDYTRSGNPTRELLEEQIAALDGGVRGLAFASGMAAITTVSQLVGAGDAILSGDDLYGGTSRLLERVVPGNGVEVVYVDTSDLM